MVFNATFNNISVTSGDQFYWWRKLEYHDKTTDLPQVMDKLYLCLKVRTVSQAHRSFKLSIANLTSSDSLDNCSDVVF